MLAFFLEPGQDWTIPTETTIFKYLQEFFFMLKKCLIKLLKLVGTLNQSPCLAIIMGVQVYPFILRQLSLPGHLFTWLP